MKTPQIKILLCTSLLLQMLSSLNARAGYWQTTVVGSVGSDVEFTAWPRVSNGRVAWNDWLWENEEVFVYENGVAKRLTNNQIRDELIGIACGHTAWSHDVPSADGRSKVNLVLDGNTVAEGVPHVNASVSSAGLAWAVGTEVHFYDGSETHTITYPGTSGNYNLDTSGLRVVWSGFDQDGKNRAYMYDGTQTVQLPDGVGIGQTPHIDGDNVTGILVDGSDRIMGVTRYNVASGHLDTFPSEIRWTSTPYISGEQMAWAVDIGGVFQLFALNSQGIPTQLTNAGYEYGPYVSDSFVAWTGAGPDGGIFTFDGKSMARLPNADAFSVVTGADKSSLVLLQPAGRTFDIILATYVVPEPSNIAMTAIACVSCLLLIRKDRRHGSHPCSALSMPS